MRPVILVLAFLFLLGAAPDAHARCERYTSDDLLVQGQISFRRLQALVATELATSGLGTFTSDDIALAAVDASTIDVFVRFRIDAIAARARIRVRVTNVGELSTATDLMSVGPLAVVESATVVECTECGIQLPGTTMPVYQWAANLAVSLIGGFVQPVLEVQLRAKLEAKRQGLGELAEQLAGVRFLIDVCDDDLAIIAYTGSLAQCGTALDKTHPYLAAGNELAFVKVVQRTTRCERPAAGRIVFTLVNGAGVTHEWTNFVVERLGGAVLAETGQLGPGARRTAALSLADYRGVPLRVVVWSPGVFGFGGIAATFDVTPPEHGDLVIELHRKPD